MEELIQAIHAMLAVYYPDDDPNDIGVAIVREDGRWRAAPIVDRTPHAFSGNEVIWHPGDEIVDALAALAKAIDGDLAEETV